MGYSQLGNVLIHLAAAEVFRGQLNRAAPVFRTLAVRQPRYRVDKLTFSPEVSSQFDAVRGQMNAVGIDVPRTTAIRYGREELVLQLMASAPHEITAEILHRDGRPLRMLYSGPIDDNLELRWDGREGGRCAKASGWYPAAGRS